jgi:HAD superfamily hydrolase (TIGR01509 family)
MILKELDMINTILFDLDGVLVDAKNIHYHALNSALPPEFKISWKDHLKEYDGLKTFQKLEMLSQKKGLNQELHQSIWKSKQIETDIELKKLKTNKELIKLFEFLKSKSYNVGVCSNSIRSTIETVLEKFKITKFVDIIVSNEDVTNSKPHPEMYWKSMIEFGVTPEKTLILEDSPHGLLAAYSTGANVMRITSPNEVNLSNVSEYLKRVNMTAKKNIPKWEDNQLNIVIPMAGAGSRFAKAGFTFPKPLIEVKGKPMIQVVVENLNIEANYIFIVQKRHRKQFNLDTTLKLIAPNCKIIEIDGITEGAACTALLAKEFINNSNPVFFANSDQYVEWNSNEFFYKMNENKCDGGIPVFESTHPKWSFIKTNEEGNVIEVQEKNPISKNATVGFYYFRNGSEFVKHAEEMILENDRVNGEFYLCPVYNYLIKNGGIVKPYRVEEMWGIGTPEDLDTFLKLKAK